MILDALSASAAWAISLRRLSRSYNGPLVEVREDGGDTLADIYPLPDGSLDIGALRAHCGVNSGFVRTWYDQSGNGTDFANTTDNSQPRLVSSGATDTLPGSKPDVPAVYFEEQGTPANDYRLIASAAATQDATTSIALVQHMNEAKYLWLWPDDKSYAAPFVAQDGSSSDWDNAWGNGVTAHQDGLPLSIADRNAIHDELDNEVALAYFAGGDQSGWPAAGNDLYLGGYESGDFSPTGYLAEMIQFDADLSAADLVRLYEDQRRFYVAPVPIELETGLIATITAAAGGATVPPEYQGFLINVGRLLR